MPESSLPDPASLRFEWLWVYDGYVPTTGIWSKELVVPASVFFVIEGLGKLQTGEVEHTVPRGSVFFAAPGTRRQWFAAGTRLMSVAFRATGQDGVPLFANGLNREMKSTTVRSLHSATRRLYRAQHGSKRMVGFRAASRITEWDLHGWCKREAAFHSWFADYIRTLIKLGIQPTPRNRPSDERTQELIRRLEAWPLARGMNVDELAMGLNIGSRRLEQLLTRDLGVTPHAHLNRRRLETARQWLTTTSIPLKQIAHDLGLRHASHFTKWFRLHAAMAPSAYREGGTQEAV